MMIDDILNNFAASDYDFRGYSCQQDELAHLFPDLIEKYRLKHSICKTLQPANLIEIGVGYGYSARAFLDACPAARYIGIENNFVANGVGENALKWAQKITEEFSVSFLIGDYQQLRSLPKGPYDLIHLSGQRNGDEIYRYLELAFEKGRAVLVDELFKSSELMQSTTWFLKKYGKFFEYSFLIPNCFGQLLIIVNNSGNEYFGNIGRKYKTLDTSYDKQYYLTDCGGYDSFRKYAGRKLMDPRLTTVLSLAEPAKGKKILDLGCGRGELAYALAKEGASVTAIDYSLDAIEIARDTFSGEGLAIDFIHSDFFELEFAAEFDVVIASDVVEHLEAPLFDRLVAQVAEILKKDGKFIVHTAPNKLNLEYVNKQRRMIASPIGCYLPPNPRTVYEDLMHLNEQTPAKLNRTLRRHFAHTLTWTTTLPDTVGSLSCPISKNVLRSGGSIFAVASASQVFKSTVLSRLTEEGSLAIHSPQQTPAVLADKIATQIRRNREKVAISESKTDTGPFEQIKNSIDQANEKVNVGEKIPPMVRFPGPVRKIALLAGRIVRFLSAFITEEQRAFNNAVVHSLRLLSENQLLIDRSPERLSQQLADLQSTVVAQGRTIAHLSDLVSASGGYNSKMNQLVSGPSPHLSESLVADDDAFYLALENRFRGSREEVKTRLQSYLPYIRQAKAGTIERSVLDLGCGRGEWLELLRDEGYVARGLERNQLMIEYCHGLGLPVVNGDLLDFLRELPDKSVGAITAFHVIEHLPFNTLREMINETYRVLTPGGVVIFETPNPGNLTVATKYFNIDPTHLKLLPDLLMHFLLEYYGFKEVVINFHTPEKELLDTNVSEIERHAHDVLLGSMEYSVVGWRS